MFKNVYHIIIIITNAIIDIDEMKRTTKMQT